MTLTANEVTGLEGVLTGVTRSSSSDSQGDDPDPARSVCSERSILHFIPFFSRVSSLNRRNRTTDIAFEVEHGVVGDIIPISADKNETCTFRASTDSDFLTNMKTEDPPQDLAGIPVACNSRELNDINESRVRYLDM